MGEERPGALPTRRIIWSGLYQEVHLLSMNHCRECDETIVHTIRPST